MSVPSTRLAIPRVSDRWVLIPLAGLLLLVAALSKRVWDQRPRRELRRTRVEL